MEITDEVTSHITNIRYYSGEIRKLCDKQLEMDFKNYDMNESKGQGRLTVLGVISGALPQIENWLMNIEVNLQNADSLEPPAKQLLEDSLL